VRRRITDAFAWLSARPAGEARPATGDWTAPGTQAGGYPGGPGRPGPEGPATWADGGWAVPQDQRAAQDFSAQGPGATQHYGAAYGAAPDHPRNRNKALVAGAGALAVVAVAAVLVTPRLIGSPSSDPGCTAYSGATLTAYNKTIADLNSQSSQATLSKDMAATISDLKQAVGQAHSATVKSALGGLLTQLDNVQSDIKSGSVPGSTVSALNSASAKADNAC
jgi:hypothetical protein